MLQKPIIATNVGGNPEIIKDHKTGLLISEKSVPELKAALQEMIDNPELRQKLAAGARKSFESSFNFEVIVEKGFIPLYEGRK